MRAAVQGEKQLFSMPNNTAIMVSFAACFALRLSNQIQISVLSSSVASSNALAPSVRTLIEETTDVLEKIGNITRHRNGMCALYAKYLRILTRKAAAETGALSRGAGLGTPRPAFAETPSAAAGARQAVPVANFTSNSNSNGNSNGNNRKRKSISTSIAGGFAIPQPPSAAIGYDTGTSGWPSAAAANASDLFQFSSMSGDQIVEALNRAGGEFDLVGELTGSGFGAALGGGGGGASASGSVTGGGLAWDDGVGMDFLPAWSNWPEFGF